MSKTSMLNVDENKPASSSGWKGLGKPASCWPATLPHRRQISQTSQLPPRSCESSPDQQNELQTLHM
jgi:hypothetical protein